MVERLKELVKKPWFWAIVALVGVWALFRGRTTTRGAPAGAEPMMFGPSGGGGMVTAGPSQGDIFDRFADLDLLREERAAAREEAQFQFAFGEEQRRAGLLAPLEELASQLEGRRLQTELISEGRLQEVARKAPVKCPPGMHPANIPGVGLTCRQLGDVGGGRGFQPFRAIGGVLQEGIGGAGRGLGRAAEAYTSRIKF